MAPVIQVRGSSSVGPSGVGQVPVLGMGHQQAVATSCARRAMTSESHKVTEGVFWKGQERRRPWRWERGGEALPGSDSARRCGSLRPCMQTPTPCVGPSPAPGRKDSHWAPTSEPPCVLGAGGILPMVRKT